VSIYATLARRKYVSLSHFQWLRGKLEDRSHAFRNQERTNRLLALMASQRWSLDDPGAYAAAIRTTLAPRTVGRPLISVPSET
jgi:hypothetical protein